MKLILIGATGTIGSVLVHQCLQNPIISCLVIFSRRTIDESPYAADPRLRVVVIDNYMVYNVDALRELEDAAGCLWCLQQSWRTDLGDARKSNVDCTIAAASAFASYVAAVSRLPAQAPFRFVTLNGMSTRRKQKRKLSFTGGSWRRIGEIERQLLSLSKRSGNAFEAYIAQPKLILQAESRYPKLLLTVMSGIKIEELASCMIDCALHGNPKSIIDHQELIDAGKMLRADKRSSGTGLGAKYCIGSIRQSHYDTSSMRTNLMG